MTVAHSIQTKLTTVLEEKKTKKTKSEFVCQVSDDAIVGIAELLAQFFGTLPTIERKYAPNSVIKSNITTMHILVTKNLHFGCIGENGNTHAMQ